MVTISQIKIKSTKDSVNRKLRKKKYCRLSRNETKEKSFNAGITNKNNKDGNSIICKYRSQTNK